VRETRRKMAGTAGPGVAPASAGDTGLECRTAGDIGLGVGKCQG